MVKSELIKRSPLRIFEKSLHGGLGRGNIGIITSLEGVGKTACLVHIAVDKMFQNKRVVHVSFANKPEYILNWYDDIFSEIAKNKDLTDAMEVHDELIKNRVIMSFPQGGMPIKSVLNSVANMIDAGHFTAETVIIDGLDFYKVNKDDLKAIKEFAEKSDIELWLSVTLKGDNNLWDAEGIPLVVKPYIDDISIVIDVRNEGAFINLQLAKDRDKFGLKDMKLKLDPKTLLIDEKA